MASRRKRTRRSSRARWIWGTVAGVALVTIVFAVLLTSWAERYIRSEAFRTFLGRKVSEKLLVAGEFAPFVWTGTSVYSGSFEAEGLPEGAVKQLKAYGLRANVDFRSFRREAWEIEELVINRLEVLGAAPSTSSTFEPGSSHAVGLPPQEQKKTFWSRFIPDKVEISDITVADSEFVLQTTEDARLESAGTRYRLTPLSGGLEDGWSILGEGGALRLGNSPVLKVKEIHGRLKDHTFYLTDSRFDFYETAGLSVHGELRFASGEIDIKAHAGDIQGEHVLRPDWRQRLLGTVHADLALQGNFRRAGGLKQSGRLWMKDAVLMALPVLDGLADYTRTERFRRLPLTEASTAFERYSDRLEFRDLRLYSDGLMRVEGELRVAHSLDDSTPRAIVGDFQVGVVRSALKWLPGAEAKVFTSSRDGYEWTTMRVQGTLKEPEEDLTPRLRAAAVAVAAELPGRAVGVGTGLLEGAAGILDGALPGSLPSKAAGVLRETAEGVLRSGMEFVPMLESVKKR